LAHLRGKLVRRFARHGSILFGSWSLRQTRGGSIAAGGVHTPGGSVGTQYIDGNYTNAGTLRVEGTPSSSDMLVVSGAVNVSGATLDLVLSPATPTSWDIINGPFTLINSTGADAIARSFASVTNNL